MVYKEFICEFCGRKAIDRSHHKLRRYCSKQCADTHYRRLHGIGVNVSTTSCIFNKEVQCTVHKCSTCGWNPAVEEKRKEALAYG